MVLKHNVTKEVYNILCEEANEAYIEIKPYYCVKLLLYEDKEKSQVFWQQKFNRMGERCFSGWLEACIFVGTVKFKDYDSCEFVNGMRLGYNSPIVKKHIDYFTIGIGKRLWLAPAKRSFIVGCSHIIYKSLIVKQ